MTATIATDTPATGDLLQRLQTMDSYGHKPYPTHFVNPDGPEAARVIVGLVAALEPFARDYAAAGVEYLPDDARFGEVDSDNSQLTVGDFRRAALTLKETDDAG